MTAAQNEDIRAYWTKDTIDLTKARTLDSVRDEVGWEALRIALLEHAKAIFYVRNGEYCFLPDHLWLPDNLTGERLLKGGLSIGGKPCHLYVVGADAITDAELIRAHKAKQVLKAGAKVAPKRVGRPKGTGLAATDAPLVERMHTLLISRMASSPTSAARAVLDGRGTDSVEKRLVRRYRATHGR